MKKKSRGKKSMIILIAVAVLLIGVIIFGKIFLTSNTYDGAGMVNADSINSVSYYKGGGEYGDSESYDMKDGSVTYRICGLQGEEENGSYIADSSLEQALEDIVRNYDMKTWSDLAANDFTADDAKVTSLKIIFTDGTIVKLGTYYQMPDNGWNAVHEIAELFQSKREN